MKLFHAFPRPGYYKDKSGHIVRHSPSDADRDKGLEILRLILSHGLLCTPEKFDLYPNYNTENVEKQPFITTGDPHDTVVQSRGCFSLVDSLALSKEYELPSTDGEKFASHTDLFGEFAIGLDPIEARSLGVLPTVYYYKHDMEDVFSKIAGLGAQIVERLDEVRNVFAVLSHIEGLAHPDKKYNNSFPSPDRLKNMEIEVKFQQEIKRELENMNSHVAAYIFNLFNTDRVPAWNLYDFIGILLSLYQTTDSTLEDAPLAFFQQREWRVVHHKMVGLRWFGLGDHDDARNPLAAYFRNDIDDLKQFLRLQGKHETEQDLNWFFDHSWVLAGTENKNFRDFVKKIVVPENYYEQVTTIVDSFTYETAKPSVIPSPRKWRRVNKNGQPEIIYL